MIVEKDVMFFFILRDRERVRVGEGGKFFNADRSRDFPFRSFFFPLNVRFPQKKYSCRLKQNDCFNVYLLRFIAFGDSSLTRPLRSPCGVCDIRYITLYTTHA